MHLRMSGLKLIQKSLKLSHYPCFGFFPHFDFLSRASTHLVCYVTESVVWKCVKVFFQISGVISFFAYCFCLLSSKNTATFSSVQQGFCPGDLQDAEERDPEGLSYFQGGQKTSRGKWPLFKGTVKQKQDQLLEIQSPWGTVTSGSARLSQFASDFSNPSIPNGSTKLEKKSRVM